MNNKPVPFNVIKKQVEDEQKRLKDEIIVLINNQIKNDRTGMVSIEGAYVCVELSKHMLHSTLDEVIADYRGSGWEVTPNLLKGYVSVTALKIYRDGVH